MNNRQYKDAFLRSKVSECLTNAQFFLASQMYSESEALIWARRGLAFSRQLSKTQTNHALAAHLVQCLERITQCTT